MLIRRDVVVPQASARLAKAANEVATQDVWPTPAIALATPVCSLPLNIMRQHNQATEALTGQVNEVWHGAIVRRKQRVSKGVYETVA